MWWALLACSGAPPAPSPGPTARPDVLLVVLDTVRADRLSAYGYERPTSPVLELLAEQGVLYEDVTSSSWTWPSHASLFTGLPPWEHGAHFVADGGVEVVEGLAPAAPLAEELPTLAERLGAEGYETVLVSGNLLLRPELGLSRGFQRVELYPDDAQSVAWARELLAAGRDAPLFLVVNLYGAHAPWFLTPGSAEVVEELKADAPWLGPYVMGAGEGWNPMLRPEGGASGAERLISGELQMPAQGLELVGRLYDGEVQRVDAMLGGLLAAWGPEGVVVVTSDHGEYLGERGLWLHGRTVYPQLTRVPLVLRAPGLERGARVSTPVELHQVHDAVLALAGVQAEASLLDPRPRPIQAAAWEDRAWSERLGGRFTQGWRSYREGDLVLVLGMESGAELYDLGADPGMFEDQAERRPEDLARLEAAAAGFRQVEPRPAARIGPSAAEPLRELGYLE